jgi:hypothetical protein
MIEAVDIIEAGGLGGLSGLRGLLSHSEFEIIFFFS